MSEFSTGWLREIIAERFVGGREGFDLWLASVERAAAEKALTDAADAVDTESTVWIADESSPRGGAYWGAQDWLRARAEVYRQERGER